MDDNSSTSSKSSESPPEGSGTIAPEERREEETSSGVSLPLVGYKGKECDTPQVPERASSAKRRLWEVDREQVDTSLHQELKRMKQEESLVKSAKWNFDFEKEQPLRGTWRWEPTADAPQFYKGKEVKEHKMKLEPVRGSTSRETPVEVASSLRPIVSSSRSAELPSSLLVTEDASSRGDHSAVVASSSSVSGKSKKKVCTDDLRERVVTGVVEPESLRTSSSVLVSSSTTPSQVTSSHVLEEVGASLIASTSAPECLQPSAPDVTSSDGCQLLATTAAESSVAKESHQKEPVGSSEVQRTSSISVSPSEFYPSKKSSAEPKSKEERPEKSSSRQPDSPANGTSQRTYSSPLSEVSPDSRQVSTSVATSSSNSSGGTSSSSASPSVSQRSSTSAWLKYFR